MGCPASLAALQSVAANTEAMKELLLSPSAMLEAINAMKTSLTKLEDLVKYDDLDNPSNQLNRVPDGWTEDIGKRFVVGDGAATVAATDTTKQLTEMEDANYYIIKEVRFYASGTPSADATIGIKDTETGREFGQGYYNDGAFHMSTGNRNGIIGRPLTQKPTVTLNMGTGAAAQKVYGTVKYYFR